MKILINNEEFVSNIIKATVTNEGKNKQLSTKNSDGEYLDYIINSSYTITAQDINEGEEFIEEDSAEIKSQFGDISLNIGFRRGESEWISNI